MANTDICEKVASFGVETKRIFGNDVVSLLEFINKAHDNLKNGPLFLETITYRLSSHVGPEDDSKIYRTKQEIEQWEKLCPIINFEKLIIDDSRFNKNEMIKKISKEISEAFLLAKESKFLALNDWDSLNYSNTSNSDITLGDEEVHSYHESDTLPEPY
jgi:pyruvate dehydrogenase E1 component alpha subunit